MHDNTGEEVKGEDMTEYEDNDPVTRGDGRIAESEGERATGVAEGGEMSLCLFEAMVLLTFRWLSLFIVFVCFTPAQKRAIENAVGLMTESWAAHWSNHKKKNHQCRPRKNSACSKRVSLKQRVFEHAACDPKRILSPL